MKYEDKVLMKYEDKVLACTVRPFFLKHYLNVMPFSHRPFVIGMKFDAVCFVINAWLPIARILAYLQI